MKLIDALGLAKEPAIAPAQRAALFSLAMEFFRSGGAVLLSDWASLSEDERAILSTASEDVFGERLQAALGGMSPPDGAQAALDAIMDRIEERK